MVRNEKNTLLPEMKRTLSSPEDEETCKTSLNYLEGMTYK
jgi:hypothetical protein